ncbi:hypothetical protein AB1N83_011432, partial [Pleurotus pulmonarius]
VIYPSHRRTNPRRYPESPNLSLSPRSVHGAQ